jgi:hypothetical protein
MGIDNNEIPMVEPVHLSLSFRLSIHVCIYIDLFQDFLNAIVSSGT